MAKRYIMIRVTENVHKTITTRKKNMEQAAGNLIGKPVRIPINHVLERLANTKVYLEDNELLSMGRRTRKR